MAIGAELLPLSGNLKVVFPNPTWAEVLRNALRPSQHNWFAGG